jgi:hypothetical protein
MDDLSSMHDPMRRAEGYRKVAAEYDDLANGAASAFFRAFFLQIAGQYREPADGGLPVMEEDGAPLASQPRARPAPKPWPAIDSGKLRYCLGFGSSVENGADFLHRARAHSSHAQGV